MVVYQNLQPPVPDAFEQRLENQVRNENELFHVLLFSCAGGKLDAIIGANYMGHLNIHNPTFFDYYFMFMAFYCLFSIFLPLCIGVCLQCDLLTVKYSLYFFIAADLVILGNLLFYHYFYGFPSAYVKIYSYYLGNQAVFLVILGLSAYLAYQWYLASKNLKQYQHGNRHRLSIILKNIKSARK